MRNIWTGLLVLGIVSATAVVETVFIPETAQAEYKSRLSQLIQRRPSMYLPTRLVIGTENRFVFRATPGSKIRLFVSPDNSGYPLSEDVVLHVGESHETFTVDVPESGVVELMLPIPNEEDWHGKTMYVDAAVWQSETSPPMMFEWVDPSGQPAASNALAIMKPSRDPGVPIMPTVPGLSTQMVHQLNTMTQALGGDERKKELLDMGDINRDAEIDQNPFFQRPGAAGIK